MATKTDSTALQRLYAEADEFGGVGSLRFISCLRYLDKMNTLLALLQEAAPGPVPDHVVGLVRETMEGMLWRAKYTRRGKVPRDLEQQRKDKKRELAIAMARNPDWQTIKSYWRRPHSSYRNHCSI